MSLSGLLPSVSVLFLLHLLAIAEARRLGGKSPRNSTISALFVFGDSTVDSGNNNYIATVGRSNFPPYGKDFKGHLPTGRFTNGKLVTDFLGTYFGIKDYIPPYLDPTLSLDDLKTGVSFASAGSGFDPLTAQLENVISVEKQLKYFQEYKSRMEMQIGKEKTRNLISNAIFLISAGTNDFILNYYGPIPIRRKTYDISAYQNFVVHLANQFVQSLLEKGARKIAIVGLPPIGCLPVVITLSPGTGLMGRGCIQQLSSAAQDYNRLLQNKLAATRARGGALIVYADIYKPIADMINNPQKFGFETVDRGCCGSGLLETTVLCNSHSSVCSDDSKYVFWDSVHPTQAAYYHIFRSVRPLADLFLNR